MKLCTCLGCDRVFEDTNPSDESKDYPDIEGYPTLILLKDHGGFFQGCPNCKTDDFLIDNKND